MNHCSCQEMTENRKFKLRLIIRVLQKVAYLSCFILM